jgi:hypothetical protein
MNLRLTNRFIAKAFGFSLPQVRRWALVVLGIDQAAEKAKGVVREYSLDEGFKIFMLGELINRMGFAEAKKHLNNIWPHLSEYYLLPSMIIDHWDYIDQEPPMVEWVKEGSSSGDGPLSFKTDDSPLDVFLYIRPGPYYEIRSLINICNVEDEENRGVVKESIQTYRVVDLLTEPEANPNLLKPTLVFNIQDRLFEYIRTVKIHTNSQIKGSLAFFEEINNKNK